MAKKSKRQSRTGDIGVHRTQGKRNAGYVKIYHDKNRKNTTGVFELKKYNPILKKYTIHKEIK